jgi:hypothetical protein
MIKILNKPLLSLICLALSIGIFTSCEKDKDANSGQVELLSFGPTGAKHGDTLRFIGNNLDQVTSVELTGASVPSSSFIEQTSELILIIVPDQALQGVVKLKTGNGEITSKTALNLNVLSSIASFTEEARPGAEMTINGTHLEWVTRVTFFNDKVVDTFVSKSFDKLVVKVPEDAQTGKLILSISGTEPVDIETATEFKVTLPAATALAPNPVKHAGNLTITGTDLDLVKSISFNNVANAVTSFESQSATEIVVKVPGATKKGRLTFTVASGVKVETATELDVVLPAATTMAPNPVDPGADLTINGTNLDLVASITFNNAPAVTSFVSQTAAKIVVKVPMGVASGLVTLGVLNSSLSVQSPDVLQITGDAPPPVIAFPIYDDAVTSNWTSTGWIGGGWGGTKDLNNTSPVRAGTKSVKIDYTGGYGSPLQLGHNAGAGINTSSYTTFRVSIYGAPGSAGKKVNIGINGADKYTITVEEGKWTDYSIPLSTLTSTSTISEIIIKEYNGTGGFTIYADAMGLN